MLASEQRASHGQSVDDHRRLLQWGLHRIVCGRECKQQPCCVRDRAVPSPATNTPLTSTRAEYPQGAAPLSQTGESAYAIKGYNSILTGQMLTAGIACFDASGTQITTGLDAYQLGQGRPSRLRLPRVSPTRCITSQARSTNMAPKSGAKCKRDPQAGRGGGFAHHDERAGAVHLPSVKPGLYNGGAEGQADHDHSGAADQQRRG